MIPDHIEATVSEIAAVTFDEIRRVIQDDGDQAKAHMLKQQAISELQRDESEYTVLGSGAGRIAVTHPEIDPLCVKIAVYSPREKSGVSVDGVSQNQQEAWTWDMIPDEIASRFTPVTSISPDGKYLVMPIVETNVPYDAAEVFVEETIVMLHSHDWGAVELDVNTVGERNGSLEVFDYGLPVEPRDALIEYDDSRGSDYRT